MRGVLVGLVIAFVLALSARHAHAQDAEGTEAAMEEYFAGEKRGGIVLVAMGVGGLIAGGLLYRTSSATARGASYPLLGLGLVHAAAGIFVYLASDKRLDDYGAQIDADPAAFIDRERPRMSGVSTQLHALEVVEVVLIAGGLTMAAIGHRTTRPRLKGAGLALALEVALTLGFDVFAARRASTYRSALARLDVTASVVPGERSVLVVHRGEF